MSSATIKLFLPYGDPKRLRIAEISNWTGKAVAAPRTDLDALLERDELDSAGIYLLLGTDPESGKDSAYIGEAEVIRDRLRQHKGREFWVSVVTFISKDENLTKAHVRYLETKLIQEASQVGRFSLENSQTSNAKLPESDREDMEVFLERIRQLLPVLGSDILTPIARPGAGRQTSHYLTCQIRNAVGKGQRTVNGFVVFKGSTAVLQDRPSAEKYPYVLNLRHRLIEEDALKEENGSFVFMKDVEFTSPSAAAAVIHGGSANGLTAWKDDKGRTLKEIEA